MIEFGVLGPLMLRRDGQEVPVRTVMLRRLLALLLSQAGRPIPVDQIIDVLWNGRPPRTARKTLSVYVSRLRSLLADDDLLVSHSSSYLVRGDLDSTAFEELIADAAGLRSRGDTVEASVKLRRALALWRGPAYGEFHSVPAIMDVAKFLEERRLAAFEDHVDLALEAGQHGEVIAELHSAIGQHPYRERPIGQLMLALYRGGRRADALEVYRRTYRRMADDLGVEPVPELMQLHKRILVSDPSLEGSTPRAVPRHLPRETPDFIGRADELRWLDDLVDSPMHTAIISAIAGTGGIGKTALAVTWAHRAAAQYPDGQLYLNLRGYGPGQPVTTRDALTHLLRAMGVPSEAIPHTEEDAAGLYRSTLAGRRMLVLLDNARSAEQVRPLLPGDQKSLVLVTSRDRLTGLIARDGARRMDLDLLAESEAIELLQRMLSPQRVAAELQAATDLARLCGYLPLALRVAAANVADRPGQTIRGYADSLAQGHRLDALSIEDDPSTAVRVVFDHSYRELSKAEQESFRLLGLMAGVDFTSAAAAALSGVDIVQAADMVDRFAASCLLTEVHPGRFSMHDLLREFARSSLTVADDTQGALTRLAQWYLEHADAACRRLIPSMVRMRPAPESAPAFADLPSAMSWLEAERANCIAVGTLAAEHGLPTAILLTDALRPHLALGFPADLLALADAAIPLAQQLGSIKGQIAMKMAKGNVLFRIDHGPEALEMAYEALELCKGIDWPDGERVILSLLSSANLNAGNLSEALHYGQRLLALNARLGVVEGQVSSHSRLSAVLMLLGDLDAAVGHSEQALALPSTPPERANALLNSADIYRLRGDFAVSSAHLQEAWNLVQDTSYQFVKLYVQIGLAAWHRDAGDPEQGLVHAHQARELMAEPGLLAVVHRQHALASVLAKSGKLAEAIELWEATLSSAAQLPIKHPEVEVRIGYADALRQVGQLGQGADLCDGAVRLAEDHGYALLLAQAQVVLAEIKKAS